MLAGRPNVAGSAGVLAGNVVAGCVAVGLHRTSFLASMAKVSLRTGFGTGRAGPSAGAYAIAGHRIAGGVIVAGTDLVAGLSIVPHWTAGFAANTAPFSLADTLSRSYVTS